VNWPAGFEVTIAGTGRHELQLYGIRPGLNRVACRCGAHLGNVPTTSGAGPALDLWHIHRDTVLRQEGIG
jgi:hypothetical protein